MSSALVAAALLVALASDATADGLFGRSDAERRPLFGVAMERLYEGVRTHLVDPVESSAARVLEVPVVQAALGQAETAIRYFADKASHDVLEPIIRSWKPRQEDVADRAIRPALSDAVRVDAGAAPSTVGAVQPAAASPLPHRIAVGVDVNEDPLERWNRLTFDLNNSLRRSFFEPAADYYFRVTTPPVQAGVRNFFANLREPATVVSHLIEGRPDLARDATARFGINTVLGAVGVFDPATEMGYPSRPRNLEQTLCVSGLPSGPYVVLPILGPATVRDSVGRLSTAFAYYSVMGLAVYVPYRVSDIALQYAEIRDQLKAATAYSLDPYTTQRILYLTYRAISCGVPITDDPDPFPK
jgi:phospholipid-binding lipoprotein MlaA